MPTSWVPPQHFQYVSRSTPAESANFGQHGKPRPEILRVIRARLIGDAEIGTEERGSEFADELFERSGEAISGGSGSQRVEAGQ